MGSIFSMLYNAFSGVYPARILMVGLEAAGKTTILYYMKIGEVITTVPTVGQNVERIERDKVSMSVFDLSGQSHQRDLWRHYHNNTDALIWVIDASDKQRIEESREELIETITSPDMNKLKAVLIFGNKQDLPGAVGSKKLAEKLGIKQELERKRIVYRVQGTCATKGEGLDDGIAWLAKAIKRQQ
eukprot:gb/GECH01013439.1/.p1 GENE.gb/GECH01013439.1/~~gb/GECH01013439.1/.p1  ORF type:complete len:186 (+),score=33.52 gb/GECH01013439.1/:1-558(+)